MSDPTPADRRQELLAKLQSRHEGLRSEQEARKESTLTEQRAAGENVDDFSRKWAALRKRVEGLVTGAASFEKKALPAYFDGITQDICAMQQYAAESTFFLPAFEVQQARRTVSALQAKAAEAKAKLLPRRKFAFKRRSRKKKSEAKAKAADASPAGEAGAKAGAAEAKSVSADLDATWLVVENRASACIDIPGADLTNRNVKLSALSKCTVRLPHRLNTLRLNGLTDTKVYVGPVAGPVYVEKCKNCTFFLASRQLRVHEVNDSNFYLHTLSKPIIEHCAGVGVAPYSLAYPAFAAQMREAGFEGVANCWDQVCDFNWLKTQKSPNWDFVPEASRESPPEGLGAADR